MSAFPETESLGGSGAGLPHYAARSFLRPHTLHDSENFHQSATKARRLRAVDPTARNLAIHRGRSAQVGETAQLVEVRGAGEEDQLVAARVGEPTGESVAVPRVARPRRARVGPERVVAECGQPRRAVTARVRPRATDLL